MLPQINTILYATDLQDHAPKVFRYAVGIAERYTAEIVLLHAIEPLNSTAEALVDTALSEGSAASIRQDALKKLHETIQQRLNSFCEDELGMPLDECRVISEARVVEGFPAKAIIQQAQSVNADLIVMGTHGRAGASELLLGSVAHKVLHRSSIPVLLIPLRA